MTGSHGAGSRRWKDRPGAGDRGGADDRETALEQQLRDHFTRQAAHVHASPELLHAARRAGAEHRSGAGPWLAPVLAAAATAAVIAGWLVVGSKEPVQLPANVPATTATADPTPSISRPPRPTRPVPPRPLPPAPSPLNTPSPATDNPTSTDPTVVAPTARPPVPAPTSAGSGSPTGAPTTRAVDRRCSQGGCRMS